MMFSSLYSKGMSSHTKIVLMAKLLGFITSPADVITQISHLGHSICAKWDQLQQSQQNPAAMQPCEMRNGAVPPSLSCPAALEHTMEEALPKRGRGEREKQWKQGGVHISGVWTHCPLAWATEAAWATGVTSDRLRHAGFRVSFYTLTLWKWKGVRAMVWPLPAPPASAEFPSSAFLLFLAEESTARSIIPVTGRRT